MTSSKNQETATETGTLIPAGLPFAYVGTWAVAGIASLAYLSFAVTQSGSEPPTVDIPAQVANVEEKVLPKLPTVLERPRVKTVRVKPADSQIEDNNAVDSPEDANRIAAQAQDYRAPAPTPAAAPPIDTKYITTSQILASAPDEEDARPEPAPAAEQNPAAAGTSNIVTGSIVVPPPPDRSPPKPAVLRKTLKPPARTKTAPKKTAARLPKPAAPAAPIAFGPATVTTAAAEPEKPAGLAVLLATGSSVESLRLTWNLLHERHAAELANLQPRYIVETNPSAPERKFALLAGPVVSAGDIARVCSALVSEGMSCRTRPFGGNAM